jgi:hypothetical protein
VGCRRGRGVQWQRLSPGATRPVGLFFLVGRRAGAARAEAQAAEEAVLWDLTALVMAVLDELQEGYQVGVVSSE